MLLTYVGTKIPYIALDAHGYNIAVGTEYESPQATLLMWCAFQKIPSATARADD